MRFSVSATRVKPWISHARPRSTYPCWPPPEGLDLIKHLREISSNFKVVLLSSAPSLNEVKSGIRERVCSYLFKPIIMRELDGCLKRALLKGKSSTKIALDL